MKLLLVVDVQKEYMDKYDAGLLAEINRRIASAVEQKELVVYVKNVRKLKSGMQAYEFPKELAVCSAHVIYKQQASVFAEDRLIKLLNQHEVTKVEIIGIDGNCCVAGSARDACKLGYQTTVNCTCIGVRNGTRFEKTKQKLAQQGVLLLQ